MSAVLQFTHVLWLIYVQINGQTALPAYLKHTKNRDLDLFEDLDSFDLFLRSFETFDSIE